VVLPRINCRVIRSDRGGICSEVGGCRIMDDKEDRTCCQAVSACGVKDDSLGLGVV